MRWNAWSVALWLCVVCDIAGAVEITRSYPLWGGEPVSDYAKQVGLPPTRTLDLGAGVTMEFVLIPAAKFRMGTEGPYFPVNSAEFADVYLLCAGVLFGALVLFVALDAFRRRRRNFSLQSLLCLTVSAGLLLGAIIHWRVTRNEIAVCGSKNDAYFSAHKKFSEYETELPAHSTLVERPFYMGKFPVTQEQYQAIEGMNPGYFKGSKNPVERVTWLIAKQYCKNLREHILKQSGDDLTIGLPTEAEWEFACRAGTRTAFHTGNTEKDLDAVAWYRGNSAGKTHPVGLKLPNEFGLYDMVGNVKQWCQDYSNSMLSSGERIHRGGSWLASPGECHALLRGFGSETMMGSNVGMRLVLTVP